MTRRLLSPAFSVVQVIMGTVCIGMFVALIAWPAHSAEREICDKMSGEQLRRCIEESARAQPAPANPAAPARPPGGPAAGAALILPPTPGSATTMPSGTKLQLMNCTQVAYPDQSFCAFRNTALLECANRGKHSDPDRCLNDTLSRAPEITTVDCSKVPDAYKTSCEQRNKVYASCRNDKINYLACLETKMGKQK